jgi:citrate lyase subunit beta/citryl-CoA lyase
MPIPIRTALFVPGNRPERIEKAFGTEADVIIVDLEDAVPFSEKESCRSRARERIAQYADRMKLVRVNPLGSPYVEGDLEEVVIKGVNGIMLPKVEGPDDMREIHDLLCRIEEKRGLATGSIMVFPLIESAVAVRDIHEIVSEKSRPERLYTVAFGAADFTRDLGTDMTPEGNELSYARSRISIACRAAGIAPPIDTPYMLDIKDIGALISDAQRAKELGFQGKLVIHPMQIEPCNRIFSPTPQKVEEAKRIVRAFEEAEAAGVGAIQLDGKFVDYPILKRSKDIVTVADAIAKKKAVRQ